MDTNFAQTAGQTDGRTGKVIPIYPLPQTSFVRGIITLAKEKYNDIT